MLASYQSVPRTLSQSVSGQDVDFTLTTHLHLMLGIKKGRNCHLLQLWVVALTVNLIFVSGIEIRASSQETELVDANLFDKDKLNYQLL
jgi:hypothetical protein